MSGAPPERDFRREYREMVTFLGGDHMATRVASALLRINVRSVDELIRTPLEEIRDIRGMGTKGVARIVARLTSTQPTSTASGEEVDYNKIARFLCDMSARFQLTDDPLLAPLSGAETEHVVAEIHRLAERYERTAREKET